MLTVLTTPIETLFGDGTANDAPAIRALFNGGCVHDNRSYGKIIAAPTLADLPHGLYRLIDDPPGEAVTRCGRAA